MSGGRMRRALVAVLGLGILAGIAFVPPAETTDAAFADAEYATATVAAGVVPTPVVTQVPGCTLSPGLLGADPKVTIYWRVPAGHPDYTITNAQFGQTGVSGLEVITGGLLGSINTTGAPSAYVTVVSSGLLGGLLGGSKTIGIRLGGPGDWTSHWLTANASMGALGTNPQCSTTTAPSF